MGLERWERAWLRWARPIVCMQTSAGEHFNWCDGALGPAEYPQEPEDPASDPSLRWPGYVGVEWRPGHGILFVGSVHSDFTKDGGRPGDADRRRVVAELADANRRWRDSSLATPAEDRRYLDATRSGYSKLLPGWSRDGAFGKVRDALGDSVDQVAWTNLAHCRAQPRKMIQREGEYLLQRHCSGFAGAFPIGDLIAAIRPVAVLSSVSPLEGAHRRRFDFRPDPLSPAPPVWTFAGGGPNAGKRKGEGPETWVPQFVELVSELRRQT